jgi:hypothetical protein
MFWRLRLEPCESPGSPFMSYLIGLGERLPIARSPAGTARDWWRPASSRASAAGKRRTVFVSSFLLPAVPVRFPFLSTPTRPFSFRFVFCFLVLVHVLHTCLSFVCFCAHGFERSVGSRPPSGNLRLGLRPGPPNPTNSCAPSAGVPPARPTRLEPYATRFWIEAVQPAAGCGWESRSLKPFMRAT